MSLSHDGHLSLSPSKSLSKRFFSKALGQGFTLAMNGLTTITRMSPSILKRMRKLKILKNISYGPLGHNHLLDIYMPASHDASHDLSSKKNLSCLWQNSESSSYSSITSQSQNQKKQPFVLYIHGGGFRTLSKDTHWPFGLSFAEEGFVTFVINYRLTPKYPCPAGLEDCAIALDWILKHHELLGIDLERGMIAGESAGGNLTLALTLLLLQKDQEPWAQRVYNYAWLPKVIAPACAFLKLDPQDRLKKNIKPLYLNRLQALGQAYLHQSPRADLAHPLSKITPEMQFDRPFPPVLITVGGADVILEDSEDLAQALDQCGIEHKLIVYPKGIHAFHAVIFHSLAQRCWQDHFLFWKSYDLDTEDKPNHL